MSPQDAITILDNVCSHVQGTREDHIKIQASLDTLRALVPEETVTEPEE